MKQVYPLSLSPEVVAMLQELPKGERSRRADEVLKANLRPKTTGTPQTLDEPKIRSIVRQILAEQRLVAPPEVEDKNEETKTLSALAQILGMRDLEGDTGENV